MMEADMKRPAINDEMRRGAAKLTADDVAGVAEHERGALADDISRGRFGPGADGFEIGKFLDREGWDITAAMVEDLDTYGWHLRDVHEAACKKWVEDNNIQPPLPIGSSTTRGEITGICSHSAGCYLIKEYGQDDAATGSRRLIVRFEDAKLLETADQH